MNPKSPCWRDGRRESKHTTNNDRTEKSVKDRERDYSILNHTLDGSFKPLQRLVDTSSRKTRGKMGVGASVTTKGCGPVIRDIRRVPVGQDATVVRSESFVSC